MADAIRVSGPVTGTDKTLSFETGKLAQQSMGAVVAQLGRTTVLATANAAKDARPGQDFFPLTIDVEERAYAAGKIPGSFFRREGRPTEDAILTCRLTDRPLRPAFPDGFRNETQVVLTVLGADMENPHDVLSINAASASLMLSGIPFDGPIGAVRIAYDQTGNVDPAPDLRGGRRLGVRARRRRPPAGQRRRRDHDGRGRRHRQELRLLRRRRPEGRRGRPRRRARGLQGVDQGLHRPAAPAGRQLDRHQGPDRADDLLGHRPTTARTCSRPSPVSPPTALAHAVTISAKAERNAATDAAAALAIEKLAGAGNPFEGREREIKEAVRSLTKKAVRKRIVEEGLRIDGRGPRDLRPLSSEVGVLPTAHGTGLFQRGETQVMNVVTMAMPRMNQLMDTLSPETHKYFLFHYNMAPWANGETGRVGSPKRREIGHGALAARALIPVLPSQDEFAYTLRLVAEVLASNGSTSMASVCSGSLALMDAGVPIKAAVAGIAMGLVFAEGKYTTLTDILGAEDAFGDMDFKVAGTADAITALQLDTKIDGIPADVLAAALEQAKEARTEILANMNADDQRAPLRGRRHGAEDRLDHHPDGQDR